MKRLTRLKELRTDALLTQAGLAQKAGLASETVRLVETGKREAQAETIQKIADALGVEPKELWREEK